MQLLETEISNGMPLGLFRVYQQASQITGVIRHRVCVHMPYLL